ncbi:EcsC family protein [Chryseobacterium caseinilyticum]|uniref:EcsC family protein n=1 Tax=Chryseobacterium caseinilyticum TaxID=2771428 RepID=A0ABR8ZFK9_9FLAO|nr:EcsC family protein [Chryseobacterium caseinilyticum]MBD8083879.1 EcsC family protein [Chryseobacterium caseinilyticum]
METTSENEKSTKMLQVLDWAYEKSLNGIPGVSDPIEVFASSYTKGTGTMLQNVNSLIRWQISKTTTSGFLTGLGGLITLPVAIPADISTGIYVHMRMIAAIAFIGGYDIKDDKVKSLIYLCLVGESVKDILKDGGIAIGSKLALSSLKSVSGKTLTKINRMVGFRLITKFGEKGAVNLVKLVPVAGGIIGGTVNAIGTNAIGNLARKTFIENNDLKDESNGYTFYEDAEFTEAFDINLLKFNSYVNLIKVDGKIAEEELEVFEKELNQSLLSEELKLELISRLYSKENLVVDYSIFKNMINDSLELITNLIKLAKIDNEFHILEKMFIKNVGTQVGFSNEEIEELMTTINATD